MRLRLLLATVFLILMPALAQTPPRPMPKPAAVAAAGGGPGLVWVNETSKVYHCFGDRYYGKTKQGKYMTEAAAKTFGAHGSHNQTCGK